MSVLSWKINDIPSEINAWLASLPDDSSPEYVAKIRQIGMVLAAQDQALPDHYSHAELMFEDMAIPIAHRQLQLEREFAEKEAAWAERLNEMQDGIERAVLLLNSEIDFGRAGEDAEKALAELNKVL